MTLPLHVFEHRYRLMIQRCLSRDKQFGVVLIAEGRQAGEVATPRQVGTIARIIEVTPLDDGRMTLTSQGSERFQLIETWETDGYLEGQVQIFADSPDDPESVNLLALRVHAMFDRYVNLLMQEAEARHLLRLVPKDASLLSFVVSAALPISLERQQQLLELKSTGTRLESLCEVLKQQITMRRVINHARAQQRAPKSAPSSGSMFSPN